MSMYKAENNFCMKSTMRKSDNDKNKDFCKTNRLLDTFGV